MKWALLLLSLKCLLARKGKSDVPCQWKSSSGFSYNLQPLTAKAPTASFYIKDGDIPCTPEIEPSFSYAWNFCADVTPASIPPICTTLKKSGVALQWMDFGTLSACYAIGQYDPKQDDLSYALMDSTDPSKGVSIKYPAGDACADLGGFQRTVTLDVECANVKSVVVSTTEPQECQYHMVMKSYHGCPTSCPITGNGLCDSHGLCHYDDTSRKAYCYCNSGYSGSDCSSQGQEAAPYDGYSVQMGLLITLMILAILLVVVVGFLVYRITELRKQHNSDYGALPSGAEMVETVHF